MNKVFEERDDMNLIYDIQRNLGFCQQVVSMVESLSKISDGGKVENKIFQEKKNQRSNSNKVESNLDFLEAQLQLLSTAIWKGESRGIDNFGYIIADMMAKVENIRALTGCKRRKKRIL
ncbi:MAG: hypothetical protein AB1390_10815 [Nitrospirota bacterium]